MPVEITPETLAGIKSQQANLDPLIQQILGQGTTSKWSGEGFGSAEANARGMADILSGIGITDIKQFGQIPQYQKLEVGGYTYNGKPAQKSWDGQLFVASDKPAGLDDNGDPYYPRVYLTADQAAQAKPIYGTYNTEYQYVNDEMSVPTQVFTPADQSKIVVKDGTPLIPTGNFTYGNKETGQAVPNTYSERQTGNAWGGTFAGAGNTGFRVQFAPDGTPYFYTTAASSNDLANILGDNKILNLAANFAAATFGGPAGVAALQVAQGNDLGDAAKAAALTYAGQQISGLFNTPSTTDLAAADMAGGMVPEFGTNVAYDSAMASAMTPEATTALSSSLAPVANSNVDYSLFNNSTLSPVLPEMGAQGIQVPSSPSVAEGVGYAPVDYSLNPSVPFEGLQMPSSPNLDSMGGAQGLTYQTPEGLFSEKGITSSTDLGDPTSFINNPAAIDQAINDAASSNLTQAQKDVLFKGLLQFITPALAVSATSSAPTQATIPVYKPANTIPQYSPEYFQQIQNYYTGYMPDMPHDVATPLQDWYSQGYVSPDAATAAQFPKG